MAIFAICDDNEAFRLKIKKMIQEWGLQHPDEEFSLSLFSSPYELLDAVSRGDSFDAYFLDILMPEMTGITLGERLQAICVEPLLVFLTSSEEFYSDAFRLYAFQYLCKPIQKNILFEVLDKVFLRCERRKHSVFALKTAKGTVQIPFYSIVYVELLSHVCHFHLIDGQHLQSKYLRSSFDGFIAPLLQHKHFLKTHTAFAINLSFAARLSTNSLTLSTGVTVPISRSFSDEVQRRYMDYALGEEDSP